MIKKDLGHLNCPFYMEDHSSKAKLYFIPKDHSMTSVSVYIGQGAYQLEEKIPFGCAYYLMKLIASPSFDQELKKDGIYLETHLDYSYTTFTLSSLGDVKVGLEKLLKRIQKVCYEEKDITALKEKEKKKQIFEDPLFQSQRGCALLLYYESPIRYGILPSDEKALFIHLSSLKRFQEKYYNGKNMAIFYSGREKASDVMDYLKNLRLPNATSEEENRIDYQEVYLSVRKDYDTIDTDSDVSYLTYGIKMPPRQTLYQSFGQMTFYVYETIENILFKKNSIFLEKLHEIHANLVSTKLAQAGEDAYLMVTLQGNNHHDMITMLTTYCSKLDKNILTKDYQTTFQEYYADCLKLLSIPSSVVKRFAYDYPNHVPTTELIANAYKMTTKDYKRILELMNAYPKSVCFARKGEQHA